MATFIMNWHLLGLVVIQFFPNAGFVFRCQSSPGFVSPPIVLVCRGHLNVVIELDDLKLFQLCKFSLSQRYSAYFSILKFVHRGSETKFT